MPIGPWAVPNREDMIDPAILRPGRLDVKIKIERPDAEAATDIFSKYVLPELPLHPDDVAEHGGSAQATVAAMIQRTVEQMYTESEENRFLENPGRHGSGVPAR
jgi:proteasome-associated ATPase